MSFDLSTTNILLAAAVAALFIAFVLVLMKLKPTSENKADQEHHESRRDLEKERPQMLQTPPPPKALPPPTRPTFESSVSNKPPAPAPVVQAPKPQPAEPQARPSFLSPPRLENREPPKQSKAPLSSVKPELTPTRKDCIHFYGYLRSLPKNTPIPDECFGCVKIVDCLINSNSAGTSANGNNSFGHNSNHNSKKRGWL